MPQQIRHRILFVNHWAKRLGGAELSLIDLIAHATQRANVHLSASEDGILLARARELGAVCHLTPCHASIASVRRGALVWRLLVSWPNMLRFMAYVMRLRRLIARLRPHVVHANVPKSHLALMIIACMGWRGRCVLHLREMFSPRSIPQLLYATLFPRTAKVIAISHAVKNRLPAPLRNRASVIYNGVAIVPIAGPRLPQPPTRLIYLGRIVPWKGCHLLVDILALLNRRLPGAQATLSLVGDTAYWPQSYRAELERRIGSLGMGARCRVSAATSDPWSALQSHHIFCSASFEEPFGRSIAEAQACFLPVVAFDSGGIGEIVEHNVTGLLAPYNDLEAFAAALAQLIVNPQRMLEMGIAARNRAAQRFNRDEQTPKIIDAMLAE